VVVQFGDRRREARGAVTRCRCRSWARPDAIDRRGSAALQRADRGARTQQAAGARRSLAEAQTIATSVGSRLVAPLTSWRTRDAHRARRRGPREFVPRRCACRRSTPSSSTVPRGRDRVDVDAVADGERVVVGGSWSTSRKPGALGDAACAFPLLAGRRADPRAPRANRALASALASLGSSMLVRDRGETIYVLEVNPRASRTVPSSPRRSGCRSPRSRRPMLGTHWRGMPGSRARLATSR